MLSDRNYIDFCDNYRSHYGFKLNISQSSENCNSYQAYFNCSFESENENSGIWSRYRMLTEYDELKEKCGNEIAFQILSNSIFKFEFNKDQNNNIIYRCYEIRINNLIIEKSLDEIKAITPKNVILINNFNKFLNILEFIIKKIKSGFSANFRFLIALISNILEKSYFKGKSKKWNGNFILKKRKNFFVVSFNRNL